MVDPASISSASGPQGPSPKPTARPAASGGAFHALLEQLASRAAELEKTSAAPISAGDLSGAVDDARASLKDALTLSDQLIEAYRADMRRKAPEGGPRP